MTARGDTGVAWIAKCLRLHPEIGAWLQLRDLAGRVLTVSEYAEFMIKEGWPDHLACGDLYSIGSQQFGELERTYGRAFRGAHLVAHLVVRLAGALAYSASVGRKWDHDAFPSMRGRGRDSELSRHLLDLVGEDADYVAVHFMMVANDVCSLLHPAAAAAWPTVKLEELADSDAAWDQFVKHISGGAITDYGARWRKYLSDPTSPAGDALALRPPREVWRSLSGEVRDIVAKMLTDEARAAYEELGYDLSFVTAATPAAPAGRRGGATRRPPGTATGALHLI